MRDTNSGRRLPLKSKLLAGATGVAAATMATAAFADGASTAPAAPPADPQKWAPYTEIGGEIGSGYTAGKLDFFAPVWQNLDSMLYARAGIQLRGNDDKLWNFGLGYRTKINSDWILGGYAGYDSSDMTDGHMAHQWSLGAELMSEDWDVRANWYTAPKQLHDNGNFALLIRDTTIAIAEGQDLSYSGFDGEVGYRVWHNEDTDFRVFAGGYSFTHSDIHNAGGIDFNVRDIQGYKARAEVNMFDLDGIGPQSRVSLEAEYQHDGVRGSGGFVGATLRIPLGDTGSGAQALDELDRRMADPQRRQENVLTSTGFTKPQPVIIYDSHITSKPTNTLYYAQQQGAPGAGSYAHPTTIQDATARGPVNQFVVMTDKGGPVVATGTTIQNGETVVGGGQTFTVRGTTNPSVHFTHDFAPGSGTPTLVADTGADNVLTLDSNSIIEGVNISGAFNDAIYGHNVTNVVISDVNIDGTGGGVNGVHIVQDVSGTSNITIQYSTVANVSNDGVYVMNSFGDGGTSSEDLHIKNTSINNAGVDGVYVNSDITGGSTATLNTELTSSSVTGSGSVGVLMSATVDATSTATQSITVDPTSITGGLYGVKITGTADGGTLNQYVNITDVDFSGQTISGAAFFAYAENGGTMNQTVNLSDVTVSGSYFGIGMIANAATGGHVNQTFGLTNVSVDGATYDGIDIVAHADGVGSTVDQAGVLQGVTANNTAFGDGVYAYAEATYGGTTIAHLNVTNLTATHNYFDGLYVGVEATSSTADASTAAQYVSVLNSNLAGNFIGFDASAAGIGNGTARQDIYVGNTVLSDAAHVAPGYQFDGASLDVFAFNGGSVQQTAYFVNDTASHNSASGIAISASSEYTGFATQTVQIYGSPGLYADFTHNGGYGVAISANASSGGDIEQNVGVYFVNASHNGLGGLSVQTNSYGIAAGYALYYSHVSQNIIAFADHFDNNQGNGVNVVNNATYGAGIDQFVYVGASTASHNTDDGIHFESHDTGASYYGYAPGTHLYADLYVFNSTVDHNGGNGISVISTNDMPKDPTKVFGDSYEIQHIVVSGVDASYNHLSGFFASAESTGIYSLAIQYISLLGSTFDHNAQNGATFSSTAYFGPYSFGVAEQSVTVTGGSFSDNHGDGIHAAIDASGFQGRAEQYFSIFDATVDHNHGDGMSFYTRSHDGAYYPGYSCGYVQGVTGGCSIARQTIQLGYDDISHNGANGIEVNNRVTNYGSMYARSGRPAYTSTIFIEDSTINNNHGDGIHLYNYVAGHSYAYQYLVSLDTNINHNGDHGISGLNNVTGDSTLVQKVVVYGIGTGPGSEIDGNHAGGIAIDSQATAGGKIGGLVLVGYSAIDGNQGDGISVNAGANSGAGTADTGVQQYIDIIGSDISHNTGYGINARARVVGAYAVAYQYLGVIGSTVSANHNDGVHAFEIAYNGAAADQSLYFNNDTISNNLGNGVYAVSLSVSQSFTEQNVLFGYKTPGITNITGNHNDGIYVGTAAFSGASAEQNIFVYNVNASHNRGDGLGIGAGSNGYGFGASYIYYSHVSQNLVAYDDVFDHNGGNGVRSSNTLYYGGTMNQTLEVIDSDMSNNHGAGFYSTTHLSSTRGNSFSFATGNSTTNYLIGDTMTHNEGNGIDIRSYANGAVYAPAFFGGYNYDQMHWQIQGTNSSLNGGNGLSVNTQTTGRYSLNAEYITISGSTFDHNNGSGAVFTSNDYYGPGGFGVSLQQVTITGSDFSHNGSNGLALYANASGTQGRAEQHFTIEGSTFDNNGGDGVHIYASAVNGTYIAGHPCTTAQGLPGGCAFVRQNVTIIGSDMSHNGNDGVSVTTYANNYGAIYGVSGRPHAPTLELYGDTVNDNNGRGLNVSNHVTGNSYLYQYIANLDSSFNGNHGDGIYMSSYVGGGSTMLQRALLYSYHTGASAHGNGGNGFKSVIEALGGSYARDVNIVEGVNLSGNGSFGFDGAISYADGTSTGLQINAVYFNAINKNGDGVGFYSIGPGAQQISYVGGNHILNNAFVGVYGEANFGAFQYIDVYSLGNDVHSNGTDYLFNAFGGSTQILN
ncbi:MAG TPA: inverse autotransporter beta domain-containing protein [Rhizomicrobium sp.]|jgi:hypothetical protein